MSTALCLCVNFSITSHKCLATEWGVLSPMEVGALWCQPELCLITFTLFCPIDLHCELFNYTIHHLLNMKNGVKHTLIKPCQKVFCKGPVNQANGLCSPCMYVCMYVCTLFHCISFFFSSVWCHQFHLILSSQPMEARCLLEQVPWINFNAFAAAFVCFVFVLRRYEENLIRRAELIHVQHRRRRRIDDWKTAR